MSVDRARHPQKTDSETEAQRGERKDMGSPASGDRARTLSAVRPLSLSEPRISVYPQPLLRPPWGVPLSQQMWPWSSRLTRAQTLGGGQKVGADRSSVLRLGNAQHIWRAVWVSCQVSHPAFC